MCDELVHHTTEVTIHRIEITTSCVDIAVRRRSAHCIDGIGLNQLECLGLDGHPSQDVRRSNDALQTVFSTHLFNLDVVLCFRMDEPIGFCGIFVKPLQDGLTHYDALVSLCAPQTTISDGRMFIRERIFQVLCKGTSPNRELTPLKSAWKMLERRKICE
jgi:hypothetical protein